MTLPPGLISAIRIGDVVPLVGSGLSRASGMASWDEIVQTLRDALKPEGADDSPLDLDTFETPDAVGLHQRRLLFDLLEEAVGQGFSPNPLHELLSRIPFLSYLTTNWDRLLETQLAQNGRVNVVFDDRTARTWRESQSPQVIKMHGSIDNPETIVFGLSDYSNFYQSPSVLMSLVRTLMATRRILAIGFGMRDPFLKALLHNVSAGTGAENYLVLADGSASPERRRYLEGTGLTLIEARRSPADPHGLRVFLEELAAQTCIEAKTQVERTRLLIRETDRLGSYLGPDRTIRVRAHLGPLAVPPSNDPEVFGSAEVYDVETQLLASLKRFLARPGTRMRLISCPYAGVSHAAQRGYSDVAHRARLLALREGVRELGEQVEVVMAERPSDLNDWIAADVALIESRKSASEDGRLYSYAKLELNPRAVFNAVRRYDEQFEALAARAGGLSASREQLIQRINETIDV